MIKADLLHLSFEVPAIFFKENFFMMLHSKNYWFQLHFSQLHPVVADPISVGYEGD